MAIEKNSFKVSRFDSEFSMGSRSRESMSSDDDDLGRRSSMDSEDDDEYDDADSGAGSDDFDLLELGECGSEFCQVGDQTCCIPFELYDLPDLQGVLSLEVWNECLTEEERFSLTKYVPDMDQETFMQTLKELFEGSNFHFGSPVSKLFEMLKGGLCEPRVALYHQGLNFFQRRQHYHLLRKHQDCMVTNLLQIRDAWQNYMGYGIQEKLRVLSIMRSRKSLIAEKAGDVESDYSEKEGSVENLRGKKSKGRNMVQKAGRDSRGQAGPPSDLHQENLVACEPAKSRKQNPKGLLKLVGSKSSSQKQLSADLHPRDYSLRSLNSDPYGSAAVLSKHAYDPRAQAQRMTHHMRGEEGMEEVVALQRDRNAMHSNIMDINCSTKSVKNRQNLKAKEYLGDGYMGMPMSPKNDYRMYDRNMNVNQLSDIKVLTSRPSNMRTSYDPSLGTKYLDPELENHMSSSKGRVSKLSVKGNWSEFSDALDPCWGKKTLVEAQFGHQSFQHDGLDARSRKSKAGKVPHDDDARLQSHRNSVQPINGVFHPEMRAKPQDKVRGDTLLNGVQRGRMFSRDEETESDSSDPLDQEEDVNHLMVSKLNFQGALLENSRPSVSKHGYDQNKGKHVRKDRKESAQYVTGMAPTSGVMDDAFGHAQVAGHRKHYSKKRPKAKGQHVNHFENATSENLEDNYFSGFGASSAGTDWQPKFKTGKNGQVRGELDTSFQLSLLKEEWRQKEVSHDVTQLQDCFIEEGPTLSDAQQFGLTARNVITNMKDHNDRSDTTLIGCSSAIKKRKGKVSDADVVRQEESEFLQSTQQQLDEHTSLKKRSKKKSEADRSSLDVEFCGPPTKEAVVAHLELELKAQKKPFTLITPTVHTGFSFSVVHLLSAVRMAMITPNPEDSLEGGKHLGNTDGGVGNVVQNLNVNQVGGNSGEPVNVPSLTLLEIINCVRSNPRDPCILETQEPLQELVRGALKIFSSKSAPLGAKSWKPLVQFEKLTKSWSWVGPVTPSLSDHEAFEEVTSPDAWGVPHKLLVKLVDAFASWLKSGQETLQQIGSLPAPPVELMQVNLDEKERFRDLRAQKSLITISPSSEEVRAYFRKEEQLRYLVPDRAFSYTAADGKKSIVAPLRRGGGKPASKARDHFMLKRDRPPHVTILCLVRDAAARLPGSIGTRADVCTLIRDSQYIVEEVSDSQINQVVSGALDRLHYERDPCVQFDGERKLWVYLHREREEEDFEDDGTSSTKKWKKPKKDAIEQDDQGTIQVAYHGSAEQNGFDLSADLNLEPLCTNDDDQMDIMYDDTRQHMEETIKTMQLPEQGNVHQSNPMVWEALGFNPLQDNKLFSQENSTNEEVALLVDDKLQF
ncbi:hypothetical protein Dimus_020477 [Dionaea muscipula]